MKKFAIDTKGPKDLWSDLFDNDEANSLLKIFIAVSSAATMKEIFEILTSSFQSLIDFSAADMLYFNSEMYTTHTRYSYSNSRFHEFLNLSDPLTFSESGIRTLNEAFGSGKARQIGASFWRDRMPQQTLFYKKETEYKYSYSIPCFYHGNLVILIQFRTNKFNGFNKNEIELLAIAEKLIGPVLRASLSDIHPAAVHLSHRPVFREDDRNELAIFKLTATMSGIKNQDDLNQILNESLKFFLPGNHLLIFRSINNGRTYHRYSSNILSGEEAIAFEQTAENTEVVLDPEWIDTKRLESEPVLLDLGELINKKKVPELIRSKYRSGWRNAAFSTIKGDNSADSLLVIFGKEPFEDDVTVRDIAVPISVALNNIALYEKLESQLKEIKSFKRQLDAEEHFLPEEIETGSNYGGIIGTSEIMKKVFFLVSQVADTSSSVLILGETGTGKELIARSIHNNSSRKKKPMIKVNCAALPIHLIESELFGHERGSFTGATDRRIGKFELAHNGTLFLDEIGELPLDLQVKLLRALQEREIERIGGTSVIKVNVRIVAATNRNLLQEVQAGNFRSDLYFRLNVIPILLPPLRDRKDDIPSLAAHFLEKHAKTSFRRIAGFSSKVMKQLKAHNWPGNVRELEHLIERCVLVAKGRIINQVPSLLMEPAEGMSESADIRIKSIDEIEREHILFVLKKCSNKVSGIGGASDILKVPASTLNSKMRRLKIKRNYPGNE